MTAAEAGAGLDLRSAGDAARTGPRHHEQLPEMVSSYVRELIFTGAVAPGDFLRTEQVAAELGVSNTPVREGLLGLRNEGLVRLVPRRGFVVVPFDRADIHDLYWGASRLAGKLAARAATSHQEAHIDRAHMSIEQLRSALASGDLSSVSAASHEFHRQINLAADSDRLAAMLKSFVDNLPLRLYASIEAQLGDSLEAHQRIHEAIVRRDAAAANDLMAEHVLAGADRLITALEDRGLWALGHSTDRP